MKNLLKSSNWNLYKIPKEIEEIYTSSIIERNAKLIPFGAVVLFFINTLCLFNVLFLSKSGLGTSNNRIYAGFYFFIIVASIVAFVLARVTIKNPNKVYFFQLISAMIILLWGVLFSTFEVHQGHTDKMMIMLAMFFSCVTFIRLKLKHYLAIIIFMTLLAIGCVNRSLTISMILELISMVITTISIPVVFYLYDVRQLQDLQELIKIKQELQQERNNAINALLREKHDQRHHNRVLSDFVTSGQKDKFLEYIEMQNESIAEDILPFCENDYLNSVLKSFSSIAKSKNIDFDIKVSLDNDISIKAVDITTIFSNLIENAIKGCENSGFTEKIITLDTRKKNDKLVIKCTNTSSDDIKFNSNGIPQNKTREGIGSVSIKTIAKKYNGHVQFSVRDNKFFVKILLNV